MTDEERKKLVHKLRRAQESETGDWLLCADAADEIEQLAEELCVLKRLLSAKEAGDMGVAE